MGVPPPSAQGQGREEEEVISARFEWKVEDLWIGAFWRWEWLNVRDSRGDWQTPLAAAGEEKAR